MRRYKMEKNRTKLKIVFPSDIELLEDIVDNAALFISEQNLNIDLFAFRLALFEGFSNAIRHGNKSDADLQVEAEIELRGTQEVRIKIKDQGGGFDWRQELCREPRDFTSPGGRGFMLMKAYGYNPVFNKKGNILTMRKEIHLI